MQDPAVCAANPDLIGPRFSIGSRHPIRAACTTKEADVHYRAFLFELHLLVDFSANIYLWQHCSSPPACRKIFRWGNWQEACHCYMPLRSTEKH